MKPDDGDDDDKNQEEEEGRGGGGGGGKDKDKASSSSLSVGSGAAAGAGAGASKDQRRRLKKLHKRATRFCPQTDVSGIIKREEWMEVKQIRDIMKRHPIPTDADYNEMDYVPWIGLRQTKKHLKERTNNRMGYDVRYVLKYSILSTQQQQHQPASSSKTTVAAGQKRPRNEEEEEDTPPPTAAAAAATSGPSNNNSNNTLSIPSWICLHNPVCIDHIAVLELHINSNNNDNGKKKTTINSSNRNNNKSNNNNNTPLSVQDVQEAIQKTWGRNSTTTTVDDADDVGSATTASSCGGCDYYPVKWFEGPRPQSISNILLYEKPIITTNNNNNNNKKKKSKNQHKAEEEGEEEEQEEEGGQNGTLMEELSTLILSRKELEKEGYPVAFSSTSSSSDASMKKKKGSPTTETTTTNNKDDDNEFRKPSSFSLGEAQAIVQSVHVRVQDEKYPFVQTTTTNRESSSSPSSHRHSHRRRVLGLDCEMVQSKDGKELGRITLIEYLNNNNNNNNPTSTTTTAKSNSSSSSSSSSFRNNYRILMDELVLPYQPIIDYVTEYSGITAGLLKNVTTRLEQIQASLLSYIHEDDIIVGHSLENDLLATRWIHPTVIDTAILFRHKNNNNNSNSNNNNNKSSSFKYSLKHLSNVLLHKRIQEGGTTGGGGHCSEEDASATLELAIRRALEGPSFAIHPTDKQWWIPTTTTTTTTTTPIVFIGPSKWLVDNVTQQRPPNGIHALTCDDIDHPNTKAISSWLTGPKRRAGLIYANLGMDTRNHLKSLQKILLDLHTKMPINSVVMVNIQPGYAAAADESHRRRMCRNPQTTLPWTDDDEKHCRSLVETCRYGSVFWLSKHPGPSAPRGGGGSK